MTTPQDKLNDSQKQSLRDFYQAFFDYLDQLAQDSQPTTPTLTAPSPTLKNSEKSPGLGFASLRSKLTGKTKKEDEVTAPTSKLSSPTFYKVFFTVIQWDHPDSIMLRFLRARKWDVPAALKMMTSAIRWFHAVDIAGVKRSGETKVKMDIFKKGESYFQGTDLDGRPVCYIHPRLHDPKAMSMEEMQAYTLLAMETSRLFFTGSVETVAIVFDLTDFAMANMDYATIKFLILVLESDYPESLGKILIINAPWFFSGIWKVVSAMLDPVVAAKIKFISSKELPTYIDPQYLRPDLGGTGPESLPYIEPTAEENIKLEDDVGRQAAEAEHSEAVKEFETTTRAWLADPTTAPQRDAAVKRLNEAAIGLDSFVRARTIYHRLGVIPKIGGADWSVLNKLKS